MTNEPRLSPSAIGCYQSCPLKYKYHYIDKLPEKRSVTAWRGIRIHNEIAGFYKQCNVVSDKIIFPNVSPELIKFEEFNRKRFKREQN